MVGERNTVDFKQDNGNSLVENSDNEIDLDLGAARELVPFQSTIADTAEEQLESIRSISKMSESKLISKNELSEKRIISADSENREVSNIFRDIRRKIVQE